VRKDKSDNICPRNVLGADRVVAGKTSADNTERNETCTTPVDGPMRQNAFEGLYMKLEKGSRKREHAFLG